MMLRINLYAVIKSYFILAVLSTCVNAAEDTMPLETMVITANRTETPEKEVGSSLTVITAEEIQKRQVLTVAEALRLVPGIDIINSGGLGHQTNVYTRGASAGQTLVLVDMVEMNDPSDPTGAFDFSNLMADNIERIEVLRGGESALYGSDAIGGVINIITKKGKGDPKFSLSGQGGSYNTFKTLGTASGQVKDVNYALSTSETQSHGFSAAETLWGNSERDSYQNTTVDGRVGWDVNKDLDVGASVRYNDGKTGLDTFPYEDVPSPPPAGHPDAPVDALGYVQTTSEVYTRGFSHLKLFDSFWEQTFAVAYSNTNRKYSYPTGPSYLNSFYTGSKIKGDWQNILHLSSKNDLMLGIEDEEDNLNSGSEDSADSNYSYNTQGYYLTDRFTLFDRSFTTASVRYTDNNRSGSLPTYSITQAVLIDEIGMKLKANYGTGFKVPTLFDIYTPYYGNPNLVAETSKNWDIGFEQGFLEKKIQFGATYFNNHFNNLIQANPAPPYTAENISTATAQGAETFIQVQPFDVLILRANYTYDYTRNVETNKQLVYRPQNKANFEANYQLTPKANINLVVIAVGEKPGVSNTYPYTDNPIVPGYAIANLAGSYNVTKNVKLFSRIDNLFNKNYQEAYGFGASGLAGFGGVTLSY